MTADRAASERQQRRSFSPSSKHLLHNNYREEDEPDNPTEPYEVNGSPPGARPQLQRNSKPPVKVSTYGALTAIPVLHQPRWMMTPNDHHDDEKSMRGVGRRRCARLSVGTLIFL